MISTRSSRSQNINGKASIRRVHSQLCLHPVSPIRSDPETGKGDYKTRTTLRTYELLQGEGGCVGRSDAKTYVIQVLREQGSLVQYQTGAPWGDWAGAQCFLIRPFDQSLVGQKET